MKFMKPLLVLFVIVNFSFVQAFNITIKLPEVKIDLPKIELPRITLPKIDLPKITLPNIKLPEIKIAHIEIGSIQDINIAHIEVGKIELPDLKIPEINIAHIEVGNINLPDINLVHVEFDLEKDLRNPGRFYNNIGSELTTFKSNVDRELTVFKSNIDAELTIAKKNVDRELTDLYQDAKDTHDKAMEDIYRETKEGLRKTATALEAAGQPENLARIALVYTASVYGGPLGSAMANALLDKLENPSISDEDLFKSFVTGAASGYASEAVTVVPSGVTSNLTRDASNIILNGDSYRAEDFLTSVATGYAKVDGGDGFIKNVVDSSANNALNYSIETVINKKEFDQEAFSDALYEGLANGITEESVNYLLDEYVIKYIPEEHKRLDKQLAEKVKQQYADLFLGLQERQIEIEQSKLRNLTPSEAQEVVDFFNEKQVEYFRMIEEGLRANGQENITFLDIQAAIQNDQGAFLNYLIADPHFDAINNKMSAPAAKGQRIPQASNVAALMFMAITTYSLTQNYIDSKDLYEKFENGDQELGEFVLDNKLEVGMLSVEALTAVFAGPAAKSIGLIKGARVTGATLAYANKLKVVDEAGLKVLAHLTDRLNKLPKSLQVQRITIGSKDKIAIVGRKMNGVVNDAKGTVDNMLSKADTFQPSRRAIREFNLSVKRYRREIRDPDAFLPDHLVKDTKMFKENVNWIKDKKSKGYTILDMGDPLKSDLKEGKSVFYEMEKKLLYND